MADKNKKAVNILKIVSMVISIVAVICCGLFFFAAVRFAEISISLVLAVFLFLLMLVVVLLTLNISQVFFRKNKVLPIVTILLSLLIVVAGGYASHLLATVNTTIDKIVQTDGPVDEMITGYFISYDNELSENSGSEYLSGKKIGVLNNDQILEGNILARQEIERLALTVTYEEYETYQELLLGLFNGEIDVAAVAPSFASSFTSDDGQDENLEKVKLVYSYKGKASVSTSTKNDVDLTNPFTVLIIGVDSLSAGNSDVLMLASFNPNTLDITLTSIARDSFVPIACYGGANNKINAARTTRQCLIDTVENLLDVDINFYFETNFQGVVEIVDALGGIVINSPISFTGQTSDLERGHKTVWVPQGEYHANGEQVLAFIRERHAFADGDFARQRHQQQVIRTLLREFLNLNDLTKILNVMEAAGENISTNMSLSQMKDLLTYCLQIYNSNYDKDSLIFDIQSSRIVGYSSWTYNTRMEMRLWIYKLFKGSIEDNVAVIKDNLELTKNLTYPVGFYADLINFYRAGLVLPTWYDEKQEHEVMPAFVEIFVNSNIKDMKSWASEHGLTLNITYVSEGDEGYDSNLAEGTVLWQSVSSGRVALISSIDVKVIKHPLDCSLSENASAEECLYTYINAVDKKIDTVQKWAKEKGITLSLNVVASNDPNYDVTKAGYVKSQTEKAYSKFNETKTLGVTYYEKIKVTFYDENDQEITDYMKNVAYDSLIDKPDYTCKSNEMIFKGWVDLETNELFDFKGTIQKPIRLKAKCVVPEKYKVTFVYGINGENSQVVEVVEGKAATAPEAGVEGYSYKWDADFSVISQDVTIKAVYEKLAKVTFVDDNGNVLYENWFALGSTATYNGATPTKASTAEYTYSFAGWDVSLSDIAGDMTVKAVFTETKIEPVPEPTDDPSEGEGSSEEESTEATE